MKTPRPTLRDWSGYALTVRINQYRKESKNARPYVTEVNRRLRTLATAAIASCNTADQYELDNASCAAGYRELAQDACEEFFELANSLLTEEQDADLTDRCYKATPQACIAHALSVLELVDDSTGAQS